MAQKSESLSFICNILVDFFNKPTQNKDIIKGEKSTGYNIEFRYLDISIKS